MFKVLNESFRPHISISCPSKCLTISIFEKQRLLWTKIATPPFSCCCLQEQAPKLHFSIGTVFNCEYLMMFYQV